MRKERLERKLFIFTQTYRSLFEQTTHKAKRAAVVVTLVGDATVAYQRETPERSVVLTYVL